MTDDTPEQGEYDMGNKEAWVWCSGMHEAISVLDDLTSRGYTYGSDPKGDPDAVARSNILRWYRDKGDSECTTWHLYYVRTERRATLQEGTVSGYANTMSYTEYMHTLHYNDG